MHHPVIGFENLHRHADYSVLDGFAMVEEYGQRMTEINQKFLCITDHGVMGAVPQQISVSEAYKLIPIFGCELYINPLQPKVSNRNESAEFRKDLDPETQKIFDKSYHLLAIAYNNTGYTNLVKLSSWGWIHGFYKRPRINHEILQKHKEGIIFTSTCAMSEIAQAFFKGGDDAGFAMIEKYMAMFGEYFYLELMLLDFKLQKPYDAFLLRAHDKYHIPLIISCDCHYCFKEDSLNQSLLLLSRGKRTLADIQLMIDSGEEDVFELQDKNLWLKSEDELNEKWESDYKEIIDYELYKQAKANTIKIADFAKGVQLDRELKLPKIPDAEKILYEEIKKGFVLTRCPKTPEYARRIREEYELIVEKEFASYFIIQKMMTDEARVYCDKYLGYPPEYACGRGRGSIAGSLVAYCLRLHDVDPIIHDLRFSRFLSPARGGKQMKIRHTIEPVPRKSIVVID